MIAPAKNAIRPIYWFFRNWRVQFVRAKSLYWNWRAQQHYTLLTEDDFRASRRSDTLFIFGSGFSLNSLTPQDWAYIAHHDTLGFNYFIYQQFVRADYHIFRELSADALDQSTWQPMLEEYARHIEQNPCFKDTILLLQEGWMAIAANALVGLRLLNTRRRILRFTNRRLEQGQGFLPTPRLQDGIIHHLGTLSDAIHLGYVGGWKEIVIAGVDLYDRRYFWLPPDQLRDNEAPDADINAPHLTAVRGIVDFVRLWQAHLNQAGIRLWCLNPKSLLTETLPVYSIPIHAEAH